MIACVSAQAQNDVAKVLSKLEANRISATYDCVIDQNGIPVHLSGNAVVQGGCFHIAGNGIEIFCDSEKLCYKDPESKEVYIEDAVNLESYIKDNIASVKDIKLTNVKYAPLSEDMSAFTLDTAALGKSWTVTDLR